MTQHRKPVFLLFQKNGFIADGNGELKCAEDTARQTGNLMHHDVEFVTAPDAFGQFYAQQSGDILRSSRR